MVGLSRARDVISRALAGIRRFCARMRAGPPLPAISSRAFMARGRPRAGPGVGIARAGPDVSRAGGSAFHHAGGRIATRAGRDVHPGDIGRPTAATLALCPAAYCVLASPTSDDLQVRLTLPTCDSVTVRNGMLGKLVRITRLARMVRMVRMGGPTLELRSKLCTTVTAPTRSTHPTRPPATPPTAQTQPHPLSVHVRQHDRRHKSRSST